MVLGDFGVDGWRMAPTLVNLSLEHILLAGTAARGHHIPPSRPFSFELFLRLSFLSLQPTTPSPDNLLLHDDHNPPTLSFCGQLTHSVGRPPVKYLGKFHGNCYAMKEVNNDEFQDIVRQLGKTRFEQLTTGQPEYDKYMQLAPQRGIRAVRARYVVETDEDGLMVSRAAWTHIFRVHIHLPTIPHRTTRSRLQWCTTTIASSCLAGSCSNSTRGI